MAFCARSPLRWAQAYALEAFCRVAQWNELTLEPVLSTSAVIPKRQLAVTVVQIEKPEDTNLGDWFAELRSCSMLTTVARYYSPKQGR
jgi:hypothetical protein